MKQIYEFERATPPALSEAVLRKKIEDRTLRHQALLVSIGGALTQVCLLALALILYSSYPLISMVTVSYVLFSTVGTGIFAVVFWKQRRHFIL